MLGSKRRNEIHQKAVALSIVFVIITSSFVITNFSIEKENNENNESFENIDYSLEPCKPKSVLTETGVWQYFDSEDPGTLAEAHVIVSDTSGLIIAADFHGFWRENVTINGTTYDKITMPGAGLLEAIGAPELPCLFEYVEIPLDIDVSINVLASSSTILSGYNIRPASHEYPTAMEYTMNSIINESNLYFGPEYSNTEYFPDDTIGIEGRTNSTPWIMRGHRLVGVSMYPIQYNHSSGNIIVYSQLIIKIKYSIPSQIQPIPKPLQSSSFEQIIAKLVLNYESCRVLFQPSLGVASIDSTDFTGAEYLIITTLDFKYHADRLAEWKNRKGVPCEVVTVDAGSGEQVRNKIVTAYTEWDLVPTYVLLIGDVDYIPANYSFQHRGHHSVFKPMFEQSYYWDMFALIFPVLNRVGDKGYIASDLGYFTIVGQDYLPEMIYGRISVDTELQARTAIDKILQYEQSPTFDSEFYNDMLLTADFHDRNPDYYLDGQEQEAFQFLGDVERIRDYLKDTYDIHVNYSCGYWHYDRSADGFISPAIYPANCDIEDLLFWDAVDGSRLVRDSVYQDYPNFGWLFGYDDSPPYFFSHLSRANISSNINDGRFMLLYFGHGGSKNMIYPYDVTYGDTVHDRQDRDVVEGWEFPCYNTTFFSDLNNVGKTPLVLSIACDTGWFDGEKDEEVLILSSLMTESNPTNPFEDYSNECFAENITRLEGGAIATIAPSRPVEIRVSECIMNGLIQAFWPGYLSLNNQPIYEMGTALLFSKLYSRTQVSEWPFFNGEYFEVVRMGFEAYNLFGDPETQLWTDAPRMINVTYPESIGTADPQRFVVNVIDSMTGAPIEFAKVCIQQGHFRQEDGEYQVGYTNHDGQVIFDVAPSGSLTHMNITVTKHNIRPHMGRIDVYGSDAKLSISPNPILGGNDVTITFIDFPVDTYKAIIIEGYLIENNWPFTLTDYDWKVWSGPTQYLNVRVIGWGGSQYAVAVDRISRNSAIAGPDPYIYSQDYQRSIGAEITWDNPDIEVIGGTVAVTVHNEGQNSAIQTQVSLWYATFGGGVTWYFAGKKPAEGVSGIVYFTPTALPQAACLKVVISNDDELIENRNDNVGYENFGTIELNSPGAMSFHVGNPINTGYVFIKVKQLGNYDNIWNASICDYLYQIIDIGGDEVVTLSVDPGVYPIQISSRTFSIEIFVDCIFVGGMIINATKRAINSSTTPFDIFSPENIGWLIAGAIAIGVVVVGIFVIKRRK